MALRKIERHQWQGFCNALSRTLIGKRVEIEVAALSLGDQIEAEEVMPLRGFTYDHKNDVFEITSEGLDHLIHKPQAVWADIGPVGLTSIEVLDADGVQQIVKFSDPLMLPAPSKE
jgi:hypothetical protein